MEPQHDSTPSAERQCASLIQRVITPTKIKSPQSAPGCISTEHGSFTWASPLADRSFGSSPKQPLKGLLCINQDQSSPINTGIQFSRDIFLRTGRFDRDIDQLLEESEMATLQSLGTVHDEGESLLDEDERALKMQLSRHLPEGNSSLAEEQGHNHVNSSIDQSNITLGELSRSAGSYIVEESINQSQLNNSESMDQSIRSALAELNAQPNDSANPGGQIQQPHSKLGNNEDIPSKEDIQKAGEDVRGYETLHALNDSFSSEMTEPEEQVQSEPPMALLMYGQPKVWTDDAGEPTKLIDDNQDQDKVDNEDEPLAAGLDGADQPASAAGLWMQEDMLQTVVPCRSMPSDCKNIHCIATMGSIISPSFARVKGIQVAIPSKDDVSNASIISRPATFCAISASPGSKSLHTKSFPCQPHVFKHDKNENRTKDTTTSSLAAPATAHHGSVKKRSPSQIPLIAKSTQPHKRSMLQGAAKDLLKNTVSPNEGKSLSASEMKAAKVNNKAQKHGQVKAAKTCVSESSIDGHVKQQSSTKRFSPKPPQQNALDHSNSPLTPEAMTPRTTELQNSKRGSSSSSTGFVGDANVSSDNKDNTQGNFIGELTPSSKQFLCDEAEVRKTTSQLSAHEETLQNLQQSRLALEELGVLYHSQSPDSAHSGDSQNQSLQSFQEQTNSSLHSQEVELVTDLISDQHQLHSPGQVNFPVQHSQQPQSYTVQHGQQPQSYPVQHGQQPQSYPIQHGQQPQSYPVQHGQQPQSYPIQHGQQPQSYPIQHGQQPQGYPVQHSQSPQSYPVQHSQSPHRYPVQHSQQPQGCHIEGQHHQRQPSQQHPGQQGQNLEDQHEHSKQQLHGQKGHAVEFQSHSDGYGHDQQGQHSPGQLRRVQQHHSEPNHESFDQVRRAQTEPVRKGQVHKSYGGHSQRFQSKQLTAHSAENLPFQGHPPQRNQNLSEQVVSAPVNGASYQCDLSVPCAQSLDELLAQIGTDVFSMEQVRGKIHMMLKQAAQRPPGNYEGEQVRSFLVEEQDVSFFSNSSFPPMSGKSLAELTAQMESLTGGSPSSGVVVTARGEKTLVMELQLVRDALEKEVFRRKHCEKQIHLLQSKLLEVQQQLAVAVNTDRRKDGMIEQLDMALAKVVEGWRRREAEKVDLIQRLQAENQQLIEKTDAQTKLLHKFEVETAIVVDQLTAAQHSVEVAQRDRDQKMETVEAERLRLLEALEAEKSRLRVVTSERKRVSAQVDKLTAQLHDAKAGLEQDRNGWEDKEQEYIQKMEEITNNHMIVIEREKKKSEQQGGVLQETQEVLAATQMEVHELRMNLDDTMRGKESLSVQLGILEDKMANELLKQEADLLSKAEWELSEKLAESNRRQRALDEERGARHHHQVSELTERHTTELKELHRQHQDALRRKDETFTKSALEFEERLAEGQLDITSLRNKVKKLEGQRMEVTSKLQSMMQAHCNEAIRILMNGGITPTTCEFSTVVNKQLDMEMYSMRLTEPELDDAYRKSEERRPQEQEPSGHQEFLPSSAEASPRSQRTRATNAVDFQPLRPDVASPPEQPVSKAITLQSGATDVFTSTLAKFTMAGMTDAGVGAESCNRYGATGIHSPAKADITPSMPFQASLPSHRQSSNVGYQGNYQRNQGSYQGSNQSYQGRSQSYQGSNQGYQGSNQGYQGSNHSNQINHSHANHYNQTNHNNQTNYGNQTNHNNQTSNQDYQQNNQTYQGDQQNYQAEHGQHDNQQQMSCQAETAVSLPERPAPATTVAAWSLRQVTRSLEPSFMETLAKEAERQSGYRMSANSSVMSELDGISPLVADLSTSTIHDDAATHHDMTGLSTGPLMDNSAFSSVPHSSTAPNLSDQEATHTKRTGLNYSTVSERFGQNDERQHELQKYLKLLLQRSDGGSGSGEDTSEQDPSLATPTKVMPSPLQFRGQGHPPGIAFSKTTVAPPAGVPHPEFNSEGEGLGEDASQEAGQLSLGQVCEISRLLGIYRNRASADPTAPDPVALFSGRQPPVEQLYAYLREASRSQGTLDATLAGLGAITGHKGAPIGTRSSHQGVEQPTKEQQQQHQQQQQRVNVLNVKVPTGSAKSSPSQETSAVTTRAPPPKSASIRQVAPPAKVKPAGASNEKKEKQKVSKVWK